MAANNSVVSLKHLNNITECPICTEVFVDHRVLPCIHTFCLKCLETIGRDKQPGESLPCPVCRKEFVVPDAGIVALQRNFFVDKLLEVKKRCSAHNSAEKTCDWCSGDEVGVFVSMDTKEKKLATKYCIQCGVSYCDQCAKGHERNPTLRRHKLEDLSTPLDDESLLSMLPPAMCDKHQSEIDVFCLDCNKAMCLKCYLKDHKTHPYADIADEAQRFRQQMNDDVTMAIDGGKKCDKVIRQVTDGGKAFEKHVFQLEKEICETVNAMHQKIDNCKNKLLEELTEMRHARMKKVEAVRGDVEMHQVALNSFRRYCEEVKDKGTDSDATRAASDLHSRALELGAVDVEKLVVTSLLPVDVTFTPTGRTPNLVMTQLAGRRTPEDDSNVVGRVEMKETAAASDDDDDDDVDD